MFCTDCAELLARVSAERRTDISKIDMIKINIDSGQGSLKVTMNVMFDDERLVGRQKDGRVAFKDSDVKRSLLLVVADAANHTKSWLILSLQRCSLRKSCFFART